MEDAERQDSVVDAAGDLIETYRDLITVRIVDHTSMGASISIVGLISLLITVFVLLFAGMGAAWWIGDVMDNMKAGFFIVGGFYTFVLIVVLASAKSVIIPGLRNMIIKKIYEQD